MAAASEFGPVDAPRQSALTSSIAGGVDPASGEGVSISDTIKTPLIGRLGTVLQSAGFRLLIVIGNAGTGILTARSLRPQGRGELAAILLLPQVLAGAVALGLPNALTFYLRKRPAEQNDFILAGAQTGVVCCILATLIGLLVAPHLLREYPREILIWAEFLLPTVSFSILAAFGRAVLEAKGRFLASNLNLAGFSVIAFAGIIGLVCVHRLETIPAGVIYALSGLPGLVFLTIIAAPVLRWSGWQFDRARELLSYGLRSYGGDLCGVLTLYIDQALVITLLSPAKMGAYVVALNLSRIINVVQQSICVVLFPRSVGLPTDEVILLNRRAMHASVIVSAVCGGSIAILGSALLRLLYGREYLAAAGVFRILLLEVVINGVVAVAAQAFMALDRPGTVTIQQVSGLILAIPLLMWLIPRFGLTGAGIAILLTTTARAVFILVSFPFVLKRPIPRLLFNAEDWTWLAFRVAALARRQLRRNEA